MVKRTKLDILKDKTRGIEQDDVDEPLSNGSKRPGALTGSDGVLSSEVIRYSGYTVGRPENVGVWVKCPLPTYKDEEGKPLEILFRTNNRAAYSRERPVWRESRELRQARRELLDVTSRLVMAPKDLDLQDERDLADDKVMALEWRYEQDYQMAQAKWLSGIVRDFSNWPFSGMPEPDPDQPESYYVLFTDFVDLFNWMLNDGYHEALKLAVKNS